MYLIIFPLIICAVQTLCNIINRNVAFSCVSVTVSTFVRILSYLVSSPATEIWPC